MKQPKIVFVNYQGQNSHRASNIYLSVFENRATRDDLGYTLDNDTRNLTTKPYKRRGSK